jgi:mono/diheme cytochrome c family protein
MPEFATTEVVLMRLARCLLPAIAGALSCVPADALAADAKPAEAKGPVSYYRDIRPLFQQHCNGCHQPAKPLGGYVMTGFADLFQKGDRDKPGVTAGKPQASMIVEQITPHADGKAEMPKARDPLTPHQIGLITRWITEGAKDDTPAAEKSATLVDQDHPPVYPAAPVVTAVTYSPDGTLLAVAGYHEVLLHAADGSKIVARLVGLSERVQSVSFSPDGKLLAVAGGSPGRFGEVQVWDVAKQKLKVSASVTFDTVYGVSWSPDGKLIGFGCGDNTVRALDAATGKQVLYQGAHSDWVIGTAFSQEGHFLVSVSRDRSVKLTEVATQRFIDNVTSITPGALKGGLAAVAVRPQAARKMAKVPPDAPDVPARIYDEILIGGDDGAPRLYKMHREEKRVIGDDFNKIREYEAMPGRIYAAAFNKDGSRFATGSSLDGTGETRVYQTEDGKLVAKHAGPSGVYAVAFAPDGKTVASAGFDGVVRLLDPDTGKVRKEFPAAPLTRQAAAK